MLIARSTHHYQQEAERCRTLAAGMKEPKARTLLEHTAAAYDELAGKVAEMRQAGRLPPE